MSNTPIMKFCSLKIAFAGYRTGLRKNIIIVTRKLTNFVNRIPIRANAIRPCSKSSGICYERYRLYNQPL
jgi:hypothetical protein